MKKRIAFGIVLILAFVRPAAFAQEAEGQGRTEDDDAGLFPPVTLEIEDLSVERIEAGEEAFEEPLMDFERRAPLPAPGEVRVPEPALDALLPGEQDRTGTDGTSFFTAVHVGAGLPNNLLGGISLHRLGASPLVRLDFAHESADGFAARPAGLGFGERREELAGRVALKNDSLSFEAEGGFRELERGLQGQAGNVSADRQLSRVSLSFFARPSELFSFSAAARGSITAFSLSGASVPAYPAAWPPTEYLAGGSVRGGLAGSSLRAGLALDYSYRDVAGGTGFALHRFRADLDARWDPSAEVSVEAGLGISTSTAVPYLLPFHARLRWLASDRLGLSLGGGYRVEERNLAAVQEAFRFADFPSTLPDNDGWFIRAGGQASFPGLLLVTFDAELNGNSSYARVAPAPDAASGLFPVSFDADITAFSLDGRVKLPLADWCSVSGLARASLVLNAADAPVFELGGEAAVEEPAGGFGASARLALKTGQDGSWEFPYLDVGAFVRVATGVKLSVEALDLLQPLAGGPRQSPAPYLAPGIRARFKMEISF